MIARHHERFGERAMAFVLLSRSSSRLVFLADDELDAQSANKCKGRHPELIAELKAYVKGTPALSSNLA